MKSKSKLVFIESLLYARYAGHFMGTRAFYHQLPYEVGTILTLDRKGNPTTSSVSTLSGHLRVATLWGKEIPFIHSLTEGKAEVMPAHPKCDKPQRHQDWG